MSVGVRFIGSGDSFGSGGRHQACILVEAAGQRLLLDCGATSLVALRGAGIDPASLDAVLISHFHGDHFGGVPFLILDQQFAKRRRPLVVAGPAGIEARVRALFDALYPGSAATAHVAVEVRYEELGAAPVQIGGASAIALPVAHLPATDPHGLRVTLDGRTIAYSGDSEWCEALVRLAADADLFICECYSFNKRIPRHLDHATLVANRHELTSRRIVLTHLGPDALANLGSFQFTVATDGFELSL